MTSLIRACLFGSVVAFVACTGKVDDAGSQDEATSCVRIEGADLGKRITVDVPGATSMMPVTFLSWQEMAPGEYIGFSLDASVDFTVKAGVDKFSAKNSSWVNPFGPTGSLVKAITYVDLCSASPIVNPPDGEGFADAGVDSAPDAGSDAGSDGCNSDYGCDARSDGGVDGGVDGGTGSGSGSGSGCDGGH